MRENNCRRHVHVMSSNAGDHLRVRAQAAAGRRVVGAVGVALVVEACCGSSGHASRFVTKCWAGLSLLLVCTVPLDSKWWWWIRGMEPCPPTSVRSGVHVVWLQGVRSALAEA